MALLPGRSRRRRSRGCNQAVLPGGPRELVCSGAGGCLCSVTWKWLRVPWGASPGWDGGRSSVPIVGWAPGQHLCVGTEGV